MSGLRQGPCGNSADAARAGAVVLAWPAGAPLLQLWNGATTTVLPLPQAWAPRAYGVKSQMAGIQGKAPSRSAAPAFIITGHRGEGLQRTTAHPSLQTGKLRPKVRNGLSQIRADGEEVEPACPAAPALPAWHRPCFKKSKGSLFNCSRGGGSRPSCLAEAQRQAEEGEPLQRHRGEAGGGGTDGRPSAWGHRRQGLKLGTCENGQGGVTSWRQQLREAASY